MKETIPIYDLNSIQRLTAFQSVILKVIQSQNGACTSKEVINTINQSVYWDVTHNSNVYREMRKLERCGYFIPSSYTDLMRNYAPKRHSIILSPLGELALNLASNCPTVKGDDKHENEVKNAMLMIGNSVYFESRLNESAIFAALLEAELSKSTSKKQTLIIEHNLLTAVADQEYCQQALKIIQSGDCDNDLH